MTNEAILEIETHIPINYTACTGVTIEKGAICKLTNPMTAVLSDGDDDIVAGIVKTEKLAAETTMNSVAIFKGGYFRVKCSGSGSAGDPMMTASSSGGENQVAKATVNSEHVIGSMEEDYTNGQTKMMWLNPTTMQLA